MKIKLDKTILLIYTYGESKTIYKGVIRVIRKHFKEYIGYNEKLQRHEVVYIFYGGLPKKWRTDTAYLTSEELGKIKYEKG